MTISTSLPRQPSPAEHRADLGAAVAATPRPEARVSAWRNVIAAARALDDSWIGDLIGAACLFGTWYILTIIAGVLS